MSVDIEAIRWLLDNA